MPTPASAAISSTDTRPGPRAQITSRVAGDDFGVGQTGVVIGRGRELEVVDRRLDAADGGGGSVVLVVGEAGIGKSTFVDEVARRAAGRQLTVTWGRCREDRGAPALWPWVQVLAGLGIDHRGLLPEVVGAAAEDLVPLLAGTGRPPAEDLESDGSASRRFRLFEAISRLLNRGGPAVCVIVEDLHRADPASLAALEHVATEIGGRRLVMVCTVREHEIGKGPLADLVAELRPSPHVEHVALGPLTDAESRRLVQDLVGAEPISADAVAAAVTRAAGHPLFLQELVRSATGAGGVDLPATVSDAVLARVRCLPPEVAAALARCSVLGRELTFADVAHLLELSPAEAASRLQPAIEAGLLVPGPAGPRFGHVLVRDALYAALPPESRREDHHRLASRPTGSEPSVDELGDRAHHAVAAAELGAAADVATAARSAGRAAAGAGDHGGAARWLDVALDAGPGGGPAHLLIEAGDAHLRSGDARAGRQRFEAAYAAGQTAGDDTAVVTAALGVGRCVVTAGDVDWTLVSMLQAARAALPPSEQEQAARLLAREGVELYWYDGDRARALTGEALDLTGSGTPGVVRTEVLHAHLFCLRRPGHHGERVRIGRELVDLAARSRLVDAQVRGWVWLIPELLQGPDLPAYHAAVSALSALAERTDEPLHRWYAELYQAQGCIARGDHDEGAALAVSARRHGAQAQAPVAAVYLVGQLYLVQRDQGDGADLLAELEELSARFPRFATMRALFALLLLNLGRREEAVGEVTRLAAHRFAAVPADSLWVATVALCAEVAVGAQLEETGRLAAALLEPYAGGCVVQGLPSCFGAVDRYIGLGQAAARRYDAARGHLERAIHQHRSWGFEPFRLRTELDLARLHIAQGGLRPPQARAVRRRLAEVEADARARGWAGLAADARLVSNAVAGVVPRPLAGPGGSLTAREGELLKLVAGGASNRHLAGALGISLNTVERHLRNIYSKLGVANRTEAAAAHVRHHTEDHGLP